MYRKMLVDGKVLYFVHAPPQTEYDVNPEARRPAPPDPKQPKLYNSVYYYWWAFLRLNGDYLACCANGGRGKMSKLYKKFGDVRDGQRNSTDPLAQPGEVNEFREWWIERGARLFAEPRAVQRVLKFEEVPKDHDMSGRVLLSVPIAGNVDVTLRAIGSLLRPMFIQHASKHGHYSRAEFKPEDTYQLIALHKALRIAEAAARARVAGERKKLSALVDDSRLSLNQHAIEENGSNVEEVKTRLASRSLQVATKLIANVGRGKFPDFSDPEPGDFIFHETRAWNRRSMADADE